MWGVSMFCKFCGNEIDEEVVVCPKCGKQVKELKYGDEKHNTSSISLDGFGSKSSPKYKVLSIILCCLGFFFVGGIHKFYEGKIGMGILYLLTGGLFYIGTIVDLINLLNIKSETYMV